MAYEGEAVSLEQYDGVWLPATWKERLYNPQTQQLVDEIEVTIVEAHFNMPIEPSLFKVSFPPEMSVLDQRPGVKKPFYRPAMRPRTREEEVWSLVNELSEPAPELPAAEKGPPSVAQQPKLPKLEETDNWNWRLPAGATVTLLIVFSAAVILRRRWRSAKKNVPNKAESRKRF